MPAPSIGLEYDFEAVVDLLDWDRFSVAFMPYFIKALNEIRGQIQAQIPDGATGNARAQLVQTVPVRDGFTISGSVMASGASARYIWFVEYGRAPGRMPPWDVGSPLYEWVKRKADAVPARIQGGPKSPESVIRSLSFLVARSIANAGTRRYRGLTPAPFATGFRMGVDNAQAILERGVQEAFTTLA